MRNLPKGTSEQVLKRPLWDRSDLRPSHPGGRVRGQRTFADLSFDSKKRTTHHERFLARMDGLIPWERLEKRIRRFYPTAGRSRHPYPLGKLWTTRTTERPGACGVQ